MTRLLTLFLILLLVSPATAQNAEDRLLTVAFRAFLDEEFRTVAYEGKLTLHNPNLLSYREDTQIQVKGQKDLFHHVDQNKLEKIGVRP